MTAIIASIAKNWQIVAISAVVAFFGFQLVMANGKFNDMKDQRDTAIAERNSWHDSFARLDVARLQLEADKVALQKKLDQTRDAEATARRAAARNASEAARVSDLLRELQETENDSEATVRVRSPVLDFLRQRQAEANPSP